MHGQYTIYPKGSKSLQLDNLKIKISNNVFQTYPSVILLYFHSLIKNLNFQTIKHLTKLLKHT